MYNIAHVRQTQQENSLSKLTWTIAHAKNHSHNGNTNKAINEKWTEIYNINRDFDFVVEIWSWMYFQ